MSDYTLYPPLYDHADFAAAHANLMTELEAEPSMIALRARVEKGSQEIRAKFGDEAGNRIIAKIGGAFRKGFESMYDFPPVKGGLADLIK